MHDRAAEFGERVRSRHGFDPEVRQFDDGTSTAADAAAAVGCDVAAIASSLVFLVDGDPVVVVTSGANRVDEAALADAYDADDAEMADPDTVREVTGWSIGGVPPFGHDESLPVVLDPTLTERETVWAAAGTPDAVFPVAPERLRDLADARVADVTRPNE